MREDLILLAASLLAGILCMILHEVPKVMLYRRYIRKNSIQELMATTYGKVNPIHFIDPIGLLFCVMFRVGFSKPSYYRMKDKELNRKLGIVGLLSIMVQFLFVVSALRFGFGMDAKLALPFDSHLLYEFSMYFLASYAIICIGMLLSNLFPLLSTDMAWLLTSQSPMKFIVLLKSDFLIKMVWILLVILGVTPGICLIIFDAFMGA
jgi:hypothetical protein